MPVIAMKVVSAENAPDAENLRVYWFEDETGYKIQVVTDRSNVYEPGEIAAVATIGTTVEGVTIKQAAIRKVLSFGLALGKTTEEVGTNLSERYGAVGGDNWKASHVIA